MQKKEELVRCHVAIQAMLQTLIIVQSFSKRQVFDTRPNAYPVLVFLVSYLGILQTAHLWANTGVV